MRQGQDPCHSEKTDCVLFVNLFPLQLNNRVKNQWADSLSKIQMLNSRIAMDGETNIRTKPLREKDS